jgi:c-di-GMP-binding flagellar brake protein YcgR
VLWPYRNDASMSAPLLDKVRRLKQKSWRRRHPRYRADFPLKATALREDGYAEIQGRCSDIGQGGMGTVLNGEVPPGEVVSLELQLPSSLKSLAVRAIVRYQKGFVHGLEFLGLSDEQQLAINSFCTGLEPSD